ncbi:uncharacterized protein LOC114411189 [Glycine soja]|uniref:uncharacterized protein LOC114411189 n=1 Tax=Glycine soja TaxID=3848 RepID=UPI00103A566A|nr:uncharacterized protein LOC114411189 [Glycine soja]
MGEVEEVQEHMKVDMSVLKNQMASIMEAMLSMRRLIESNTATATATSTATEADLVLPSATNQANQLAPDMVGRGRDALGNTSGLHRGDADKEPREHAQLDIDSYPLFTTKGSTPNALPQPNTVGVSQPLPMQPLHFSVKESPLEAEGREKLDFIEERLRAVEGFGDYPFVNMTDLCLVLDVVIPPKFKVPDFDRYKGTTCPKNHLKMYYNKLVGYMPSSFADLVFVGERIEVGLKRGKFDYVSPANTNNRRYGPTGAKRKERDAHVVTSAPAWPKF